MSEINNVLKNCIECGLCLNECDFLQKYCQFPKELAANYNEPGFSNSSEIPYSCNICSLCELRCPQGLNIGKMALEMRREMVEDGFGPLPQHDTIIDAQEFYVSDDFKLTMPSPDEETKRVFFPGCSLSAYSPQLVKKTYEYLNEKLPGTGLILGCCGGPSYLTGDIKTFESISSDLISEIEKLGANQLILSCPFCYNLIKKHYENHEDLDFISLYNLLDEIGNSLSFNPSVDSNVLDLNDMDSNEKVISSEEVAFPNSFNIHDPCTARYEPDIHSSVRSIIKKAGFNVAEIDHSKEESHCCGMGGMVYVVDEELGKLRSRRVLDETELNTVTYCATCRETLQGQGGNILHILDLIFNLDWKDTLNKPSNSPETSSTNMKLLKKELYDKYSGK